MPAPSFSDSMVSFSLSDSIPHNLMFSRFMPADALWTLAMACNVYLTFFHKYNSEQLRRLEWKYVLCCYGLPFIPAFVYFFINTQARGRVYGSAIVSDLCSSVTWSSLQAYLFCLQLWCWVALPWDCLRIIVFHGPVWFVISLTFAIYLRAGSVIYQKRRQLRVLGAIESCDPEVNSEVIPKCAGIQVTREIAYSIPDSQYVSTSGARTARSFPSPFSPYSVTIEGGPFEPIAFSQSARPRPGPSPLRTEISLRAVRSEGADSNSQRRSTENNSAAWAYTKYAMLFFIALLVTWVIFLLQLAR